MTPEERTVFADLRKAMNMAAAVYPDDFKTGVYNNFSFNGKTYTLIKHGRGEKEYISYWGGGFLARKSKPSVEVQIKSNYDSKVAIREFTGLQNILLRWYYLKCVGKRL